MVISVPPGGRRWRARYERSPPGVANVRALVKRLGRDVAVGRPARLGLAARPSLAGLPGCRAPKPRHLRRFTVVVRRGVPLQLVHEHGGGSRELPNILGLLLLFLLTSPP